MFPYHAQIFIPFSARNNEARTRVKFPKQPSTSRKTQQRHQSQTSGSCCIKAAAKSHLCRRYDWQVNPNPQYHVRHITYRLFKTMEVVKKQEYRIRSYRKSIQENQALISELRDAPPIIQRYYIGNESNTNVISITRSMFMVNPTQSSDLFADELPPTL